MARTEALPAGAIEAIAAQIGRRIAQMVTAHPDRADRVIPLLASMVCRYASGGMSPSIGESFSFWMLDASCLLQPSEDLRRLARNTGRWHHQITLPSGGTAYARSSPEGDETEPSNWVLRELFEAVLADRISKAIPAIDRQVPDNYIARLLSVPAFQLNVLWLVDERSGDQKVMVLTAPPDSWPHQSWRTLQCSRLSPPSPQRETNPRSNRRSYHNSR